MEEREKDGLFDEAFDEGDEQENDMACDVENEMENQPESFDAPPEQDESADGLSAESQTPTEPAEELYTIKHLGQELSVDRARMTELAQQGMDYARVRAQRDEYQKKTQDLEQFQTDNAELVETISDLARETGMTGAQFLDKMRESLYVQKGMSEEAAAERVARVRLERQLQNAQKKPETPPETTKHDTDVQAFCRRFPDVKPEEIDPGVWAEVASGKTLLEAYESFQTKAIAAENKRLKEQLAAAQRNEVNKQKTIGTQKSGATEQVGDPFLDALFA